MGTHFAKGIEFAVNTVNRSGGVLNKQLKAVIRDDKNNANIAMQMAQTFSNQGITAVVGHWSTNVSYYTEDIYENNKIVMITPRSTGMILFEEKFDYIFRIIGSNQVFAQAIASNMAERAYKHVVIYFSEDEFGIDFAKILEKELNALGIRVIDRVTSITSLNIDLLLNRWNAFGCDGIAMAATYPGYVNAIRVIRQSGSLLPIFGGDDFEELSPEDLSEKYFDDVYVATLNVDSLDIDFLKKFRAEYGHSPDAAAVSAYEAVMLIRDAMQATQSIDGTAIATYLSSLKDYKAVSGVRTYNTETQEFDGYNIQIVPLKPIIFEGYNE